MSTFHAALWVLWLSAAPVEMKWRVDGEVRQALVYAPVQATASPPPLVFSFHGHGGTMKSAAGKFRFHEEWPEAVVVYPQGLPTPGMTDPEGKKPGWQKVPGDLGDRDLAFFDVMLAAMKEKYGIDARRVYATGHSNGGGFTYLLWAERAEVLAALAPSSGGRARLAEVARIPLPVFHLAGTADRVVPIESQERMMAAARARNGCEEQGRPWRGSCTLYPSAGGTPVVTYVHDGGHAYPDRATSLIVKFFQEYPSS